MDCSAGHQSEYRPGAAFGDRAPPATCPTDRAATVTLCNGPVSAPSGWLPVALLWVSLPGLVPSPPPRAAVSPSGPGWRHGVRCRTEPEPRPGPTPQLGAAAPCRPPRRGVAGPPRGSWYRSTPARRRQCTGRGRQPAACCLVGVRSCTPSWAYHEPARAPTPEDCERSPVGLAARCRAQWCFRCWRGGGPHGPARVARSARACWSLCCAAP